MSIYSILTLVPKSGKLTQPPALPFHASLSGTSYYSYLNRALLPGLAHCFMSITDLTQSFCLVHCDTLFWFAYTGVISSNYAKSIRL